MKNKQKKQMAERIYRENENRMDKGIDKIVRGIRLQRIPVELFDLAIAS